MSGEGQIVEADGGKSQSRAASAATSPRHLPATERMWTRIEKTDTCWLWKGHIVDGYGLISVSAGRKAMVHRLVYEQLVGPIPEGMQLDHLCRVRNCVNPDHLEVVTPGENTRRGASARATNYEVRRAARNLLAALDAGEPLRVEQARAELSRLLEHRGDGAAS